MANSMLTYQKKHNIGIGKKKEAAIAGNLLCFS